MKQILDYTLEQLESELSLVGEKPFRAKQIWEWLYVKRVTSFEEMTNISKALQEKLAREFVIEHFHAQTVEESTDGTQKYLFELSDGMAIETVLMKQKYGYSICVTTQVGCNIGCSFCASGQLKKIRNLSTSEIVNQVLQVQRNVDKQEMRVSHVVIMGIGEPFDNYDNVTNFIKVINHPKGLAIGARHITVSTSGIVPKIYDFSEFDLQVNLAISLHSANNEKRSKIMKINDTYPLEMLSEAVAHYIKKTNRRVTFEYLMLNDVNDSIEDADMLVKWIGNKLAYVNLIPYNSVSDTGYKQTSKDKVLKFYDRLKKKNINVTIRREFGRDITAACGQLRANNLRSE